MHYLKRHIPLDLDTFNISRFSRLPLWVVEYKSLQVIVTIVAYYIIFFLVIGIFSFYVSIVRFGEEFTMYDALDPSSEQTTSSPFGFSVFMAVSAFTNCGLSLRPLFRSTHRGSHIDPSMLFLVDMLALAGNTCFPVFLRWIITCLSYIARPKSNRKIYFRYLLLNGRSHYSYLFTSQQTWLLFSFQFLFLFSQGICLRFIGKGVNMSQAVFMSINTRHSGFSALELEEQNAAILVLFLFCMFLAPTPFVVVLRRSLSEQSTRNQVLVSDVASIDNAEENLSRDLNDEDEDGPMNSLEDHTPLVPPIIDLEELSSPDSRDNAADSIIEEHPLDSPQPSTFPTQPPPQASLVKRWSSSVLEGLRLQPRQELSAHDINDRLLSRNQVMDLMDYATADAHNSFGGSSSSNDGNSANGFGIEHDTRHVLLKRFGILKRIEKLFACAGIFLKCKCSPLANLPFTTP